MNTDINLKFNNTYEVKLIDSKTNKIKQEGVFHNIVLNTVKNVLVQGNETVTAESSHYNGWSDIFYTLHVGRGTTEPKITDTKLASKLWSTSLENVTFSWLNNNTGRAKASVTFPATSSYVGTVTEVGLCAREVGYNASEAGIVTRALLTDSEGQVITFNKTDLDILIITVTVELTISSNNDFKVYNKCKYIPSVLYKYTEFPNKFGYLNLCRFYDTVRRTGVAHTDKEIKSSSTYYCNNDNGLYIRYPVTRLLATDITDECYYKAISIPLLGCWELPNENIFPAYSINSINIGIGDGVTTSFTNPLSYFKKDTDKVYKNGILLVRGVDYTINNLGNVNCLPELTDFLPLARVYCDFDASAFMGRYDISAYPLIIPSCNAKSIKSYDRTTEAACFNNDNPLYVEYTEPVSLNCFKSSGGLCTFSSGGDDNRVSTSTKFYLDYSLNGEEYIEIGNVNPTDGGSFVINFETITAKYWRIRTSSTRPICMYYMYTLTLSSKDPYIVFAEAPLEGDIITMDVEMDIIMKNSNFVVDVGAQVNFSI